MLQSNIDIDTVKKAINNLSAEEQELSKVFRIEELTACFASEEAYKETVNIGLAYAELYLKIAGLMGRWYEECLKIRAQEIEKSILENIYREYDSLSEQSKEEFCNNMVKRSDFFTKVRSLIGNREEAGI
ncbi:MAG: hypothetical protein HDR11_01235 [Lachnospiraceae bacterium]|nr:hypothetical protein [Lachnospiraceae bacterium]